MVDQGQVTGFFAGAPQEIEGNETRLPRGGTAARHS
jgi:hypothetical protein